jgi:hypothetical protein
LNTGIVIIREIPDQDQETKDPVMEMGNEFAQLSHNQVYSSLNDCQENIDDDEPFLQTPLQDDINILHKGNQSKYDPNVDEETSILGFSSYSSDTSSTNVPSLDSDNQENNMLNATNIQRNLIIDDTLHLTQDTVQDPPDSLSMPKIQDHTGKTHLCSLIDSNDLKIYASAPLKSVANKKIQKKKCSLLRNRQTDIKIKEESGYYNDHSNDAQEVNMNHAQLQPETVRNHNRSIPSKDHPILVANSLFNHWIDKHDYHKNLKKDKSGKFASDIILELARLVTAQMNN